MSHPLTFGTASRREFLRRAAWAGACAGSPFAVNLMGLGAAAAQNAQDHKALVCVFLAGGNDQSNTLIPAGSGHASYALARPQLALPLTELLRLSPEGAAGEPLGLHPALAALKPLFDQKKLAVVANVGTLTTPLTQAQWNNGSPTVSTPFQLFSHADQQGAWQTGLPDAASETGWLGRMGDLTSATFNGASPLSMAMSVAGNNLMLSGRTTVQYQVSVQGAIAVESLAGAYGYAGTGAAVRRLLTAPRSHLLENELTRVSGRAIEAEVLVNRALAGVPAGAAFPDTDLGRQLSMVARLIGAHAGLAQKRQIFFVQQGGYDFHDHLLTDQASRLQALGDALAAFQQTLEAQGLANQVTTFTASDFGRALQSNGRGSDHGWGGHHFVLGGAVEGQRVFGQWPEVALGGAQDAGQGRLIPTTSVDEYAATLATWFGVSRSDLPLVLPNVNRFAHPDLGFMRATG